MNFAVVVLGVCGILDVLLARLSLDPDFAEVRTLTGAEILYRKPDPEARMNTGAEIDRWRNTLFLDIESDPSTRRRRVGFFIEQLWDSGEWWNVPAVFFFLVFYWSHKTWGLLNGEIFGAAFIMVVIFAGMSLSRAATRENGDLTAPHASRKAPFMGVFSRPGVRCLMVASLAALANFGIVEFPDTAADLRVALPIVLVYLVIGLLLSTRARTRFPLTVFGAMVLVDILGSIGLANAALDRSAAITHQVTIEQKQYVTRWGRWYRSRRYFFTLRPWNGQPHGGSIEVSAELYRALRVGDPVCIPLHRGAFEVSWFRRVAICPDKPATPSNQP